MTELRSLTEDGRRQFVEYLQRQKAGSGEAPPLSRLGSEPFSREFEVPVGFDATRGFPTRYQLGAYVNSILSSVDRTSVLRDHGIWDWLSLAWFEQLCPLHQGTRKVGETARYVVSSDRTDYYRHLVRHAWDLYGLHGVYSRLFLECPPHKNNDFVEKLACRQDIITNKPLIEAADSLYWDRRRGRPKTGATNANRPGNVRRFVRVVQQLGLTYDLHSMSAAQILSLLPREFQAWRRS